MVGAVLRHFGAAADISCRRCSRMDRTLKFEARKDTLIQLRGLNTNDEAWASNKKSISVKSILKDGVISID